MRKLFWIGSPFFQESLTHCLPQPWQVHFFNFEEVRVFTWDDLVNMAGFEPDVVLVSDKSRPPFVLGIEDFPCFTVFYAIDTHIHSWYPYYAQAFDACLVSLKDHIPLFYGKRLQKKNLHWSPAFAKDTDAPRPHVQAIWDCLFVGTVDSKVTPKRHAFLQKLQKHIPVHCTRGNYAELFPQGRIIINYCEHGDLNFRAFEALGCGSCLVTPRIGHGATEIFTHHKHVFYYDRDDVDSALTGIKYLLQQEQRRKDMAQRGLEVVNAGHRAIHRAHNFIDFFEGLGHAYRQECIQWRRQEAKEIRNIWLKPLFLLLAEAVPQEHLRHAYLQAARGIF